jgi:hypothetical protein
MQAFPHYNRVDRLADIMLLAGLFHVVEEITGSKVRNFHHCHVWRSRGEKPNSRARDGHHLT